MNVRGNEIYFFLRALVGFVLAVVFHQAHAATHTLTRYEETVLLEKDGSATVRVQCNLTQAAAGDTLLLPFAFAEWPHSFSHDDKIQTVFEGKLHARRQVALTLTQSITTSDTLHFSFRLLNLTPLGKPATKDFGNYDLSYRVINVSAVPIASYTVRVVLPAGMVVNTISSSVPARANNAPTSPYTLEKFEGRHCLTLRDSTVFAGDHLALSFQAKAEKKSPWFIVVLTLIAAAYLFAFRDLVRPRQS